MEVKVKRSFEQKPFTSHKGSAQPVPVLHRAAVSKIGLEQRAHLDDAVRHVFYLQRSATHHTTKTTEKSGYVTLKLRIPSILLHDKETRVAHHMWPNTQDCGAATDIYVGTLLLRDVIYKMGIRPHGKVHTSERGHSPLHSLPPTSPSHSVRSSGSPMTVAAMRAPLMGGLEYIGLHATTTRSTSL